MDTKVFVDIYDLLRRFSAMPKSIPKPTAAELALLRVLWRHGPSTVREVLEHLDPAQETGYTTVLKLLQIMTEKGLVRRDESRRTHIYQSAYSEEHTQRQLLGDLLDKAFGGSAKKLVLQALSTRKTSPEELREIRSLLDQLEKGSK
jgi:BlaI family transcriptional regulator, penicillinase repressor